MSKCVVVGVTMFSASLAAAASAMEAKTRSLCFAAILRAVSACGVVNAGEFHQAGGVEFGIDAGVMLAERAGAENGDFDFCHARSLPVNGGNLNQKCRAKMRRWRRFKSLSISFAAFAAFVRHCQLSTFNFQL